jgi:hypothetical protein
MRGILGAKLDFISESSNGLMVTIELTPPLSGEYCDKTLSQLDKMQPKTAATNTFKNIFFIFISFLY